MTAPTSTAAIDPESWKQPGSAGFWNFIRDIQPRVRSSENTFIPWKVSGTVKDEITAALDSGCGTLVFSHPRRHGKTCTVAMVALWRLVAFPNTLIAAVANSARQSKDTHKRYIFDAFTHTPALQRLVDAKVFKLQADNIRSDNLGSSFTVYPANAAALYGKALNIALVGELHAADNSKVLHTLQGSLIDSRDGLLLCDSTVGPPSSPIAELHKQSLQPGSGIYFSHISYPTHEVAIVESPEWIDKTRLRQLSVSMPKAFFDLQHCNLWGSASSALFTKEQLEACIHEYELDPQRLAAGRAYVVSGGLDRAASMMPGGDATITSAILQIEEEDGPHWYVMASDQVFMHRLAGIRANILDYSKRLGMTRLGIEDYNTTDVIDWCRRQEGFGANVESFHPSRPRKADAFAALYAAVAEGRFHVHPCFAELIAELSTIEIRMDGKKRNGRNASDSDDRSASFVPDYGHPKARGYHDDRVYSLLWASYALREVQLSAYELDAINCTGSYRIARLCALNGGAVIPPCADTCRSMQEAMRHYRAYADKRGAQAEGSDPVYADRMKNRWPAMPPEEWIPLKITARVHTLPRAA